MIKPNFTTLTQLKLLLGISNTTYDTLITNYIPLVNDYLVGTDGYLNNEFLGDYVGVQNSTTIFTLSTVKNISIEGVFVIDGQDDTEYLIKRIDFDNKTITTDITPLILSNIKIRIRSIFNPSTILSPISHSIFL